MDYKYIEQLLERYWQCGTTTAEEAILKAFFSQDDVPAELEKNRALFVYEQQGEKCPLGDDFDARILAMTAEEPKRVKARRVKLHVNFAPLFKAAAVVAVVITLGNAMQMSMSNGDNANGEDINYAAYKDTYDDPAVAYDKVENALQLMSEGISKAEDPDTAAITGAMQK